MLPIRGKRRIASWRNKVAERLYQLDMRSSMGDKLQRGHLRAATWSVMPTCLTIAVLAVVASPLTWNHDSLVGMMQRAPSDEERLMISRKGGIFAPARPAAGDGDPNAIHVAMIFDEGRLNFTVAAARSLSFYASQPIVYHFVAPPHMHADLAQQSRTLVGNPSIRTHSLDRCKELVGGVWYIAKHIHMSAMCKLFLAEVLPLTRRILYVDSDTTIVGDVSLCSFHSVEFGNEQYIGMGVDMGESCQLEPDLCYPIGFQWTIPDGLECATVPFRAHRVREAGKACRKAGGKEPYQYNGGVMLMDLDKMRRDNFTAKFVQASQHTWRTMGHVQAAWGEQDMINNFFRFRPDILQPLPCGCNYQYAAARRESKCGNQTVVIAHAWTRQVLDASSRDRFNLHFNFFRFAEEITANSTPPEVLRVSMTAPDWNGTAGPPEHVADCPHQRHTCTLDDRAALADMDPPPARPPAVNILTRTSGRPTFFREMTDSIREQTYPAIRHLVLTDDAASLSYMADVPDAVLVDSLVHRFHPEEVCDKCADLSSGGGSCASAPSLERPEERQAFFDCYCNTSYPMNEYMNTLQKRVLDGWIMYLDDDNLLQDAFSISELMGHVASTGELVAFRSTLGRVTPHEYNFGKRVVMGDFDSSNFLFHSSHLKRASWPGTRCGDFKVGSSLSRHLPIRWIDSSFIQSNPLRDALGGLGQRQEFSRVGLTVVITSYMTTGWRPLWVKESIELYLGGDMVGLVAKVILVWNNADEPVPAAIPDPAAYPGRLIVLRPTKNSLNNRWIDTLAHVDGDEGSVLNLDDDLYTTRAGLICMLNWHSKEPRRMIAPFVRRIEQEAKYVMDELKDGSRYSVVLPRIMLVPVKYMRAYASAKYTASRSYVDAQGAHCDDILLNIVALQESSIPPLRVLLPENAIVDFYSSCWSADRGRTGGLGLQTGRTERRSECVRDLMRMANLTVFKTSTDVATCLPRGNALVKRRSVERRDFDAMAVKDVPCGGEA
jgi:Glycosyl transferase family 64 domain/Glycosyl transferase family 8